MQRTRRFVVLALVLAVALGACTGGGGDDGRSNESGPSGGTESVPTPVGHGNPTKGTYVYETAGVRVVVDIDGTTGTMEVHNTTDHDLGDPGFYIFDARDGSRVDGEVASPASIGAGKTATFDISFTGLEVKNIGLLVLTFGTDNYGAFVRTA